nr:MAG TPA: hypothetical protein [Caudoviricetes sp.]
MHGAFSLSERNRTMNTPKFELPMEAEIRIKMDVETHKKFVQYCTEHHTTRAEVVRQLIDQLMKESKESK